VEGPNNEVDGEPQYAEVTVITKQPGRRPRSNRTNNSTAIYADINHTLNKSRVASAAARRSNQPKARR